MLSSSCGSLLQSRPAGGSGMMRIEVPPMNRVAVMALILCIEGGGAILQHPAPLILGAVAGVYFLFAIKVIQPWEKVALLRLGRYVGLRGPGLFLIVPVIESLSPYVDPRV